MSGEIPSMLKFCSTTFDKARKDLIHKRHSIERRNEDRDRNRVREVSKCVDIVIFVDIGITNIKE